MANRADMPKAGFDSVKFYVIVPDIHGPFLSCECDSFEEVLKACERWEAIGIQPIGIQRVVVSNFNPKLGMHARDR